MSGTVPGQPADIAKWPAARSPELTMERAAVRRSCNGHKQLKGGQPSSDSLRIHLRLLLLLLLRRP